ncbi:ABC transporter substrate-binding protein [Clostridium sp. MSJ-11]|uniref:ABC transporter substrate-binding protein n=1 Tax=Clostridium mobile TaxID=2841512 RepID=A0ABS6EFF0_9CLOT|nr:ABC transporter substrate-binding protein [Clostridium mobile]MBU5483929.1 ABC transporter substrate-binding protein [Clostridium mobile]
MKNKTRKFIVSLLSFILLISFTACSKGEKVEDKGNSNKVITIKDSTGKDIEIKLPVERVVSLNRQTSEALKILEVDDKVVGTGDTTVKNNPYLGFDNVPDLGKTDKVNIEEIIKLKPEIVFAHTNRNKDVLEEKLEPVGIKVVRIDNYLPEKMNDEMKLLGQIFSKEDRVKEFLDWKKNLESLVEERVKGIEDKDKKSVLALSVGFLNSDGGYRVFPSKSKDGKPGVGEGYATILAGGKDAGDLEWNPSEKSTTILVNDEYVLKNNPEVVTLHGTWLGGYNEENKKAFEDVLNNIKKMSSLEKLDAGKNDEVYIFHTDMLGANKRPIGVLQLAKYLYPEKFKDVEPEQYAKEYFNKWLGTEYKGIWFYSAKDK